MEEGEVDFFFLVTALLGYNSHILQLTHLKLQFKGFWYIHRIV